MQVISAFISILLAGVRGLALVGSKNLTIKFPLVDQTPAALTVDQYICGNILFSAEGKVFTTNLLSTELLYDAMKSVAINSLVQLSPAELLILITEKYCIVKVDRRTKRTETYIGSCGQSGSALGHRLDARFRYPYDLKLIRPHLLLLLDTSGQRLLYIDTLTDTVSRAVESLGAYRYINQHPTDPNIVYLTFGPGIREVHLDTGELVVFFSSFSGNTTNLAFINGTDEAIFTDFGKLKLVDFRSNQVITLCDSTLSTPVPGPFGMCTIKEPAGLLVVDDEIYIAGRDAIFSIKTQPDRSRVQDTSSYSFIGEQCYSEGIYCGYSDKILRVPKGVCSMLCVGEESCDGFEYRDGQCRMMTSSHFARTQVMSGEGTCFV